jgi:hypothetical protein
MAIISLPGSSEFMLLAIVIVYWYFIIISIIRRPDLTFTNRLLWMLILLVAPLIGLFIYNIYGKTAAKA